MLEEMKEIIGTYEEVIANLCQLYQNIGIAEKPTKIYETFRYMCLNGYLSCDKYFESIPNSFIKLENIGYVPMDVNGSIIMANYGVCRHMTDFLSHIYGHLSYNSSQLFLHTPITQTNIYNNGSDFLTNDILQQYLDKAMQELDLFSKQEVHIAKKYSDITITIDYFPSVFRPTHTVNIVKDKKEDRVYIFDTRNHSIGDIIDEKQIILKDLESGFRHISFVVGDVLFDTYYGTDYEQGLWLLNTFDTQTAIDVLDSILYLEKCKKFEDEYKDFKSNNQKNLNMVANNYQKLIKTIKRY